MSHFSSYFIFVFYALFNFHHILFYCFFSVYNAIIIRQVLFQDKQHNYEGHTVLLVYIFVVVTELHNNVLCLSFVYSVLYKILYQL